MPAPGDCRRFWFVLVPACFLQACARRGQGRGQDDAIFACKIAAVQRPEAASPGRSGGSLSARPPGGLLGMEGGDFPEAGRLLAVESALALRASTASV